MGCVSFIRFIGSGGSGLLKCFQISQTIKSLLNTLREYPGLWQSPVSNVQEENQ